MQIEEKSFFCRGILNLKAFQDLDLQNKILNDIQEAIYDTKDIYTLFGFFRFISFSEIDRLDILENSIGMLEKLKDSFFKEELIDFFRIFTSLVTRKESKSYAIEAFKIIEPLIEERINEFDFNVILFFNFRISIISQYSWLLLDILLRLSEISLM